MRLALFAALPAYALLSGCANGPLAPTLTFETHKTPQAYAACVAPMLPEATTVTEASRRYRIVVPSSLAADNVIEAYKAPNGGKVFVYARSLVGGGLVEAARACA
ncbi:MULTISPECIES: hypothetical protein [unclassified Pseudomonas]|uniref:hypothetical protein n=1 Tax=unclassified Pseudomonas TaxID=196821 RepID=UPI000BC4891F|nr:MULTISPECIES: hypothetical protein [unclassified Pseudomonas]PVZ19490.1 hypothetical protein F474_00077 [Pseudomonas sp. URIL14HWK12:I12]PVZ22925.1 hypothetical protein F470_03423 [Pseudomonas sp. URIL14HWK12:I10]PVZ37445.1 hypothetical protein F472_00077 [Pseudomonas sp. URIL14HWK12:I11]SNZ14805.1 hypothetical protein SAMN05660463_02871 [Pseudomonas sp. URIL14HWK12:I9]